MDFLKHFFSGICSSPDEKNVDHEREYRNIFSGKDDDRILQIRQQLEYYLSPANLRSNKDLNCIIMNDPERFVPLSTLLSYNKLKLLKPTKSEINSAVFNSKILEFSSDMLSIRTKAASKADDPTYIQRSVKFIGFDKDDSEGDIREAIYSQFGKFERLSLLHKIEEMTHEFNGSVIVVFETVEQANEATNGMEFNGQHIQCEKLETMRQKMTTYKKLRKNNKT